MGSSSLAIRLYSLLVAVFLPSPSSGDAGDDGGKDVTARILQTPEIFKVDANTTEKFEARLRNHGSTIPVVDERYVLTTRVNFDIGPGYPEGQLTAYLHAQKCELGSAGPHYKNDPAGPQDVFNENWPVVTCSSEGVCTGAASNIWTVRCEDLDAGLSIVVDDLLGEKMLCADLVRIAPGSYEGSLEYLPFYKGPGYGTIEGGTATLDDKVVAVTQSIPGFKDVIKETFANLSIGCGWVVATKYIELVDSAKRCRSKYGNGEGPPYKLEDCTPCCSCCNDGDCCDECNNRLINEETKELISLFGDDTELQSAMTFIKNLNLLDMWCPSDKPGIGMLSFFFTNMLKKCMKWEAKCIEDPQPLPLPPCGGRHIPCGGSANLECPEGLTCVDDPDDDCNPDCGGEFCWGVCVGTQLNGATCGTTDPCPSGYECVDDRSRGTVDPNNPLFDRFEGTGFNNDCMDDADCVVGGCSSEVCAAEPAFTTCEALQDTPSGNCLCIDKKCIWARPDCGKKDLGRCHACAEPEPEPSLPYCGVPMPCGGIAGILCPDGFSCVDKAGDDCNPVCGTGAADCGGRCVATPLQGVQCGFFPGGFCPSGYECLDNPNDECSIDCGIADCPGLCYPCNIDT